MTVYVDDMRRPATVRSGRGQVTARWSHLTADTREELDVFAARIGLRPQWRQAWATRRYHYDVTDNRRDAALAAGAQPITYPRGMAQLLEQRRLAESATSDQAGGAV